MHIVALIVIVIQISFILHAIKTNKPFKWLLFLLVPVIGALSYFLIEFLPENLSNQPNEKDEETMAQQVTAHPVGPGRNIAYITQGKLFFKSDAAPLTQIQSQFGQKVIDKTLEAHRKNEWKTESSGSHFGGSALWGIGKVNADRVQVAITSVARTSDQERIYYFLETEAAGGLFLFDHKNSEEKRLFHKEKLQVKNLDFNDQSDRLVGSQVFGNGTANIVVMNGDGSNMSEVTTGDSVDEAPSWIPGKKDQIIFQSSGVARNREGYAVGKGPASLQLLDLTEQKLLTVLEDRRYDFLQPHVGPDGYLYFIRRPYETNPYNDESALIDFFLFPFRLIRAVFHYLNFFSMVYSNKPLTTASGPMVKGDDMKNIILKGKVINAEKNLRKGTSILGIPSLVPSSWELVKRDNNGQEEVLAKSVVSFDIHADGTIGYSNGNGIFTLDPGQGSKLIVKDNLIEDIVMG